MSKTRETKKSHGLSGLIVKLAVAAAAVYLVFTIISGQMQVSDKRRQLNEITTRVTLQMEENAELQRMMNADDDKAFVERMARERIQYARPKERVFIDLTGQ